VCHRCLTARCLAGESRQYWDDYAALLVEGLSFVDSFVGAGRTATPASMLFFKGLFKLMLVILHDFPLFAHAYCHYLCGYIPLSCIQLRNVVLSAFPYPELPDPFQTKFSESNKREENRVRHEISGPVMDSLKGLIDPEVFLKAYREKSVVPGLLPKLKATDGGRSPWNIHAINAVTLAISNASLTLSNEEHDVSIENPAVRQFVELCDGLDDEGRYYLINACANHLRCPNSHTNFFGHLLLFFFTVENQRFTRLGETGAEATREQVTRVLAERLTAVRPHPWGLLVVLLELVDNQQYRFNQRPFINCSPEVANTIKELQASIVRQQGNKQ
jgi:CCR4-NOT transcription complex subunit 1